MGLIFSHSHGKPYHIASMQNETHTIPTLLSANEIHSNSIYHGFIVEFRHRFIRLLLLSFLLLSVGSSGMARWRRKKTRPSIVITTPINEPISCQTVGGIPRIVIHGNPKGMSEQRKYYNKNKWKKGKPHCALHAFGHVIQLIRLQWTLDTHFAFRSKDVHSILFCVLGLEVVFSFLFEFRRIVKASW